MFETEFIAHRVNTIEELKQLPTEYGVELDLRGRDGRLFMQHDPFKDGEDFEEYLKYYSHGTMILNIKSERIEYRVLELIKHYHITQYFFLDSSFPMIQVLMESGEKNIALRFSEYEKLDTIFALQKKIKWVWVDCFTKLPIDSSSYKLLKEAEFKLCLVSPDLLGRENDIPLYKSYLSERGIAFEAICTKYCNIEKWQ